MKQNRPTSILSGSGLMTPDLSRRSVLSRGIFICSAIGLLPLAGCGGGEPSYYTLATVPGTAAAGGPLTVEVRTPSVASFLDRDYIVRSDRDTRLRIADNAAWASALSDMIGRTLTLDLGQRLPGSNVYLQSGAISTQALAIVELDVARFMEDEQGRAQLVGSLAVHRPGAGPVGSHALAFSKEPDGGGIAALVAALSALLGQAADVAAAAVRALPPIAVNDAPSPN